MFIYQITATTTTLQTSINEFDAAHQQMKNGGQLFGTRNFERFKVGMSRPSRTRDKIFWTSGAWWTATGRS